MRNLTEVHEKLAATDTTLRSQEEELVKQAEEEDAAGRIMARGFTDELNKLAGGLSMGGVANAAKDSALRTSDAADDAVAVPKPKPVKVKEVSTPAPVKAEPVKAGIGVQESANMKSYTQKRRDALNL